jgi:hypothetical protein
VLEILLRAVEGNREIPERLRGWRYAIITEKLINHLNSSN